MKKMNFRRVTLITFTIAIACASTGNLYAQTKDQCLPGFIWDGEKCVSCVRPCDTGLKGACGRGLTNCVSGKPVCEVTIKPGERMEVCNGEDDDCDGEKDEGFDKDKDGYTTCGGDCDDRNIAIHPDAVEKCDGIDDDCNGIVDDGFDIGSTCSVGRGACAQKGKRHCSPDGAGVICDAVSGTPKAEVCDGIDNDCDGVVDNGLGDTTCGIGACRQTVAACVNGKANRCAPLKAGIELCGDNIDNDCDGRIDEEFENLKKPCRKGVGLCERSGVFICSEDNLSLKCDAVPGPPQQEICGNRIDDDCNGIIDDAAGMGQPCDNGQMGECRREGTTICDTRKGAIVCSAAKVESKAEKCDNLDNDCDGEVDEGVKNVCGGCGELPAKVGDACRVAGADVCGTGVWECDKDKPGSLICSSRFDLSENKSCPDDGNLCTKDFCSNGVCSHAAVKDGTVCNDGNECTIADLCLDGECKGGGELACEDGNTCTADRCDSTIGCIHEPIGAGFKNACGSCDILEAQVGESCSLPDLSGICAKGEYRCTPEEDIACVETVFASEEICNAMDDDCDQMTDEYLGETVCGIGNCQVTIANCAGGKIQTCLPLQPTTETCENMGSDDDCNGITDDVARLGVACPFTVGTCIIPGTFQCLAGNNIPVCAAASSSDAADEDADGIPNYCDRGGIAVVSAEGVSQLEKLFEYQKTRAAMLPWAEVYDSIVTSGDLKYSWLLVSGANADLSGIAALPVRKIFEKGQIAFRDCSIENRDKLKNLTVTSAEDLFASSPKGYYRFPKISSQLSMASGGQCNLNADIFLSDDTRPWSLTSGQTSESCKIQRIASMASSREMKNTIAGAVVCALADAAGRKMKYGFGVDIINAAEGAYEHLFIPLWEAAASIDSADVFALSKRGFGIVATIDFKTSLAFCRESGGQWGCTRSLAAEMTIPLSILKGYGTESDLFVSNDGSVFELTHGKEKPQLRKVGFLTQLVQAESSIDDVTSSVALSFGNPHALTFFHGKDFGGPDLFSAFDINQNASKIGTMGFFYWNGNEPPQGTISDIKFDGSRGTAKFDFIDPTGDAMNITAHITAKHGGSLDHWIEKVDRSEVRFTARGETASSVGVWPIRLAVDVVDTGGAGIMVVAVISHDGTVESIQETAH